MAQRKYATPPHVGGVAAINGRVTPPKESPYTTGGIAAIHAVQKLPGATGIYNEHQKGGGTRPVNRLVDPTVHLHETRNTMVFRNWRLYWDDIERQARKKEAALRAVNVKDPNYMLKLDRYKAGITDVFGKEYEEANNVLNYSQAVQSVYPEVLMHVENRDTLQKYVLIGELDDVAAQHVKWKGIYGMVAGAIIGWGMKLQIEGKGFGRAPKEEAQTAKSPSKAPGTKAASVKSGPQPTESPSTAPVTKAGSPNAEPQITGSPSKTPVTNTASENPVPQTTESPSTVPVANNTQSTSALPGTEPIVLSKSKFGHTFTNHGESKTDFLTNRARASDMPQGQFLDDQAAAQFIRDNAGATKNGAVSIPIPKDLPARVIMPDGTYAPATKVRLVPSGNGVKTAYPEL